MRTSIYSCSNCLKGLTAYLIRFNDSKCVNLTTSYALKSEACTFPCPQSTLKPNSEYAISILQNEFQNSNFLNEVLFQIFGVTVNYSIQELQYKKRGMNSFQKILFLIFFFNHSCFYKKLILF